MNEPLGRDRLGRLVYAGDLVRYCGDIPGLFMVYSYSDPFTISVNYSVDLNESPKRTFYERYFADLGPIEYIDTCYVESASQADDDDLFWFDFEHDLWWYFDHANFMTWLQQEATV